MSNATLRSIAIVTGVVLFVPAFVISPALSVVLVVILILAFIAAQRMLGVSEVRLKKDDVGYLLNRMWIPVRDELSEVVRTGGRVTSATSVWTGVPNLYKQEAPTTFHQGMERYVNERAQVAALVASVTATEESRRRQELVQQQFLFLSRELLAEAKKAIYFIPGSDETARRAEAARPRPAAQQTRSAATGASAESRVGARQPSASSRTTQAQTATPAPAISARPAPPRPAPMRSANTSPASERAVPTPTRREPEPPPTSSAPPPPPSKPAPPPPRVTYKPMPSPPAVITPDPQEPEPTPSTPSPPPTPTPTVASAPEMVEELKPPEPTVAAPTPQPISTPSDLRLDVASVCEELFDPKVMSYEANRLFDDKYKDATVRWKGTVRRASAYSYDFNFGDGGGTKAELDVYEVKQQYGSRTVKAFVQLPTDAATDIGGRIGEEIEFEGRLLNCEGSARRLYVADARMVD